MAWLRWFLLASITALAAIELCAADDVYFQGFDLSDGGYSATGSWEWGEPSGSSSPELAHTPPYCWGTYMSAAYPPLASDTLDSVEIAIASPTPLTLMFYHWYELESPFDGGNVKLSVNGGDWTVIQPVGGYPLAAAYPGNAGIPGEPCFSGSSGGWTPVEFDLGPFTPPVTLRFRWHFGSDVSVQQAGWFIDSILLYEGSDFRFALTPDQSWRGGDHGSAAAHLFTVSNTGMLADSYDIRVIPGQWPAAAFALDGITPLSSLGPVDPHNSLSFLVKVTVQGEETDVSAISVTSRGNPASVLDAAAFTYPCPAGELPLEESFEERQQPPDCWQSLTATPLWTGTAAAAFDGSRSIMFPATPSGEDWLISPPLDLSFNEAPLLQFSWESSYRWNQAGAAAGVLDVRIRRDDSEPWSDSVWSTASIGYWSEWEWDSVRLLLLPLAGWPRARIAFRAAGADNAPFLVDMWTVTDSEVAADIAVVDLRAAPPDTTAFERGQPVWFYATLTNNGTRNERITVTASDGVGYFSEVTDLRVPVGSCVETVFPAPWIPEIPCGGYELRVEALVDGDSNPSDNLIIKPVEVARAPGQEIRHHDGICAGGMFSYDPQTVHAVAFPLPFTPAEVRTVEIYLADDGRWPDGHEDRTILSLWTPGDDGQPTSLPLLENGAAHRAAAAGGWVRWDLPCPFEVQDDVVWVGLQNPQNCAARGHEALGLDGYSDEPRAKWIRENGVWREEDMFPGDPLITLWISDPSVPTPAPTPSPSPSPEPTETPTAVPTATVTPVVPYLGADLRLDRHVFTAGDRLTLSLHLYNPGELREVIAYVALQIGGDYWFWPSWSHYPPGIDAYPVTLPAYSDTELTILDFIWPAGIGPLPELAFAAGMTDPLTLDILGEIDVEPWTAM